MDPVGRCELHEAVVDFGGEGTEALMGLARSPIGAECQRCAVCRWARTFIERRLAERTGRVLPMPENADAAWAELQTALRAVRASVHAPP